MIGQPKPFKKLSLSMAAVVACIIGIGLGILGLNYYHATRCTGSESSEEMELYIKSIEKRLLQAESQNIRNAIVMDKIIKTMQSRLTKLEISELEKISQQSQDQAVKIALELAGQPAPPMPDFPLDPKYTDAESLADIIDDVLSSEESGSYEAGLVEGYKPSSYKKEEPTLSDADASTTCLDWKSKYEVITGVSWGKLPYDLQLKWMTYHCDQHISKAASP
eukprot:gene8381-17285_t